MAPLSAALSHLTEVSEQLNRETDSLNGVIEHLEQRLAEGRVGIGAWLDDLHAADHPSSEVALGWYVGYGKSGDGWRIVAKQVRENFRIDEVGDAVFTDAEDVGPVLPLVKAPRAVRAEAAANLEKLIDLLAKKAARFLNNIERAKALVDA